MFKVYNQYAYKSSFEVDIERFLEERSLKTYIEDLQSLIFSAN